MLGHLSARGRLHLREKCTTNHGKLTTCAFIHACTHACRLCWGLPFGPAVVSNPKSPRGSFLHADSMHACMHISCIYITRACEIHNITMMPAINCALSPRIQEIIMILVMQGNLQSPVTLSSSKSPCTAFQRDLVSYPRDL